LNSTPLVGVHRLPGAGKFIANHPSWPYKRPPVPRHDLSQPGEWRLYSAHVSLMLADKVVETTDEGKVHAGMEAVLAAVKSDTWNSAEYTDLKVTVFGHTAIATGPGNQSARRHSPL
jgi:hypothetical protein